MISIFKILALLAFAHLVSCLTVQTTTFTVNQNISKTREWTIQQTGMFRLGRQPRRISSASCGPNLYVAWTATVASIPNPEIPQDKILVDITAGRISRFDVTKANAHIQTINFDWCNEMGSISVSEDCTLISVLCRSSKQVSQVPGAIDLIAKEPKRTGFGWFNAGQPDMSQPNYRPIDRMYLLEFTGVLNASPSKIVMINNAIGGFNTGHHDLVLNTAKTRYFITLKATVGRHDGAIHIVLRRTDWTVLSDKWGCGEGHVNSNRVSYNKETDTFFLYCWTDYNFAKTLANGVYFWTSKSAKLESKEILTLPFKTEHYARIIKPWGGPRNAVSLGAAGFLAVAVGPVDGTVNGMNTVGIVNLPVNSDNFDPSKHKWKWFKNIITATSKDQDQIAFQNIQVMGLNRNRFLLGWSPKVAVASVPVGGFQIVEIDQNGCMRGPITTLKEGGWGAENVWTYIPATGCVVMTYVYENSFTTPYGSCSDGCIGDSRKLRLTTVCPGSTPAVTTCAAQAVGDEAEADLNESGAVNTPGWVWGLVAVGVAVGVVVVVVLVLAVFAIRRKQEERV